MEIIEIFLETNLHPEYILNRSCGALWDPCWCGGGGGLVYPGALAPPPHEAMKPKTVVYYLCHFLAQLRTFFSIFGLLDSRYFNLTLP